MFARLTQLTLIVYVDYDLTMNFYFVGFLFPNEANNEDLPDKLFIQFGNLVCLRDVKHDARVDEFEVNIFNTSINCNSEIQQNINTSLRCSHVGSILKNLEEEEDAKQLKSNNWVMQRSKTMKYWNTLSADCVNAVSVYIMFKTKHIADMGGPHN